MHIHGRRLNGGGTSVAAVGAQRGFVALYNDSTIGHILRVVSIFGAAGGAGAVFGFFVQGTVGSLVGRGIPLNNIQQAMAGTIYSGTDATALPNGVLIANNGWNQQHILDGWRTYISPGFSFVLKDDTVNLVFGGGFVWEDLEMSQLEPHELD